MNEEIMGMGQSENNGSELKRLQGKAKKKVKKRGGESDVWKQSRSGRNRLSEDPDVLKLKYFLFVFFFENCLN